MKKEIEFPFMVVNCIGGVINYYKTQAEADRCVAECNSDVGMCYGPYRVFSSVLDMSFLKSGDKVRLRNGCVAIYRGEDQSKLDPDFLYVIEGTGKICVSKSGSYRWGVYHDYDVIGVEFENSSVAHC